MTCGDLQTFADGSFCGRADACGFFFDFVNPPHGFVSGVLVQMSVLRRADFDLKSPQLPCRFDLLDVRVNEKADEDTALV